MSGKIPYIISEVICCNCGNRWIAARPYGVLLRDIECAECGKGFVIETGEILRDVEKGGVADE